MPTEPVSCMAVTSRHVEMPNVGFDVKGGLQNARKTRQEARTQALVNVQKVVRTACQRHAPTRLARLSTPARPPRPSPPRRPLPRCFAYGLGGYSTRSRKQQHTERA